MKQKRKGSIQRENTNSILLLVVIIISLIAVSTYFVSKNSTIQDVRKLDTELVVAMNKSFDNMVNSFKKSFNYLTMNRELQDYLKEPYANTEDIEYYLLNHELQRITTDIVFLSNELHSLYLFDENENLRSFFKRTYYKGEPDLLYPVLDSKSFSPLGNVTIHEENGQLLFKRRILDLKDVSGIGYLVMVFDKTKIQQQINVVNTNQHRHLVLLDENNQVIAASTDGILADIEAVLEQKEYQNSQRQTLPTLGDTMVTFNRSYATGWTLLSLSPMDQMLTSSKIQLGAIILVGVVGVLIAFIFVSISSKRVLDPIVEMTELTRSICENEDFDQRLTYRGNNEIGELTDSFNHLLERINYLINQVYLEEIKRNEAQMQALQAQINPHFLYNTLDCINWLAEFNRPDDIRAVTVAFANIMKISANNEKTIPIKQEMEYLKDFLSIYAITLQNKLQYEIQVAPEITAYHIPKLILQPLVENAVIHGVKRSSQSHGYIVVKAFPKDGGVVFQVLNSGQSFPPAVRKNVEAYLKKPSLPDEERLFGIGLRNVIDRLFIFYGKDFNFTINSEETRGTVIEITIPRERLEEA